MVETADKLDFSDICLLICAFIMVLPAAIIFTAAGCVNWIIERF